MEQKIKVQKLEVSILETLAEISKHLPTKTILMKMWLKEDAKLNKMEDEYLRGEKL
jgi:hypothetical protein